MPGPRSAGGPPGEPAASRGPAAPGTWPGDPATPQTPVAHSAAGVRRLAATPDLAELNARISVCRACARLVAWREYQAQVRKPEFDDQPYWGRPVPGFGDEDPTVLIVGLAPAAHGANRTGRNFTGDRSGDTIFAALHRTGFASQETSTAVGDGQELTGLRMIAAVRCAPPANKPSLEEKHTCAPWLERELALLPHVRVIVCLGAIGWAATLAALAGAGHPIARPRPKFGHGAVVELDGLTVLGCFHPSPHNTQTGRLTATMLDALLLRAKALSLG